MGAALPAFLVSSAAAILASSVFLGTPQTTETSIRSWMVAPVLACCIVLSMGCLVVLTTAGGRRGR